MNESPQKKYDFIDLVVSAWNAICNIVGGAVDFVLELWNNIVGATLGAAIEAVKSIVEVSINIIIVPLNSYVTSIIDNIPSNSNSLSILNLRNSENLVQSSLVKFNSISGPNLNSLEQTFNNQASFGIFTPLFDLIGPSSVANLLLEVLTTVINSLISSSQLDIMTKVNNANLFNSESNQDSSPNNYNPLSYGNEKYSTDEYIVDVVNPGFEQLDKFVQFINDNPEIYNLGNKFSFIIQNLILYILNIDENPDNLNDYLYHAYRQFAITTGINIIGHFVSLGIYGLELNNKKGTELHLWLKILQIFLDLSKIALLTDGILSLSDNGIDVPPQFFIELAKNFLDGLVAWWTGFKVILTWSLLLVISVYAVSLSEDNWSSVFGLVFIYKSVQEAASFYLAENIKSKSFIGIIGATYMFSAIGDVVVLYNTFSILDDLK